MLMNRNASESFISRFLHVTASDMSNSYLPMQERQIGLESEFLILTKNLLSRPQFFIAKPRKAKQQLQFPSSNRPAGCE